MENEKQVSVKGWCVLTETISGQELVWRTGEGDKAMPVVFSTERAAQLEIVEDIQNDIDQFIDGERGYDEIHQFSEYTVAEIEVDEQGVITVWSEGVSGGYEIPGVSEIHKIIEVSLKQWRENL